MRRTVSAAAACLTVLAALAAIWQRRGPPRTWQTYVGRLNAGGRPTLLFFDSPSCGWSALFREEVLVDPQVVQVLAEYRCFQVVGEATVCLPDGRLYVSDRWPTLMAFDARAEYLGGVFGWKPVEVVAHELNRMLAGMNTVPALREQITEDPDDSMARWLLVRQLLRFPEERREQELRLMSLDPTGSTTGGKLLRLYDAYESDRQSLFRADTDPLVRFHVWWNDATELSRTGDLPAAWTAYQRAWIDCPPDWKPVMVRTLSRLSQESSVLCEEIEEWLSSHGGV